MKVSTRFIIALGVASFSLSLSADEAEEINPSPGFRPECELASAFIADVKTSTVRVYPTIIRSPTNTTYSAESQQQVVAFLNGKKIIKAVSNEEKVDPGELQGRGQFDWFQNDMATIGREVKSQGIDEDYILVMEVLFPPQRGNRQSVFGIDCIVLDAEGSNGFSFLLNSHHQMFVEADLVADEVSEQSRAALVEKATAVGLEALVAQIQNETMRN